MIAAVDFYRHNNEHVPVNASLLIMIMEHFSSSNISLYAEDSHAENIEAYIATQPLKNKNHKIIKTTFFGEGDGKIYLFKRILYETKQLFKLSKKLKNEKITCIVFLSLSPINSLIVKRFLFKKKRSLIVLHGDLEFIKLDNEGFRNFLGKCFLKSFKIKNSLTTYVVLSSVVKQNLLSYGVLKNDEIVSVFHPYVYKTIIEKKAYEYPFVFAHVGIASMLKQSFLFFKLAADVNLEIKNNKTVFKLIGKNQDIPERQLNQFVLNGNNRSMLSRKDYEEGISNAHYIVFFHSNDNYEFTVSGSILDAIDYEKPVIALKNDLFLELFATAGNIGFLCDNYEEMLHIIQHIAGTANKEEYLAMQKNMKEFKTTHSLQNLQQQLFSQRQLSDI